MIIQGNAPCTQPLLSLRNRVLHGLWALVWLPLLRPSSAYGWLNLLLRLFGARIGRNVHVSSSARGWAPWQLRVGDRVGVGPAPHLYNMALLTIADGAVISQGAQRCGGTHDVDSSNFQLIAKPIDIGTYAWVCADAFVGPGVTIAAGCALAAPCVATKSIREEWTVWAGNPALFKRHRQRRVAK